MYKTQYAILIVVLLVVAAYGVFIYLSGSSPQIPKQNVRETENALPAPNSERATPPQTSGETPPQQESKTISVEKVERNIKEVIALKNTNGGTAGEAVLSVQNGKVTISLRADKLPDPGKDRYAGWMYKEGAPNPIYLGPLSKISAGEFKDSLALGFQDGTELQTYKTVAVTRETDLGDFLPEKKILEGKFK